MKNDKLYPFERNRFFYGKLLTVRDFETEQRYFNDKRRIINRLINGAGVLCGLQVVAVDDKTVSVKAGVALDYGGREIVVSQPVTQKLSMIEGFNNNDYIKNVYLCIGYDERGKETVHSVAGASDNLGDVVEYNRIQEGYKLYIREDAPKTDYINFSGLFESRIDLYYDSQLRVTLIAPKFTNTEEEVEFKVRIEKALQVQTIELKFEAVLDGFIGQDGGNVIKFSFVEEINAEKTYYEKTFKVRTVKEKGEFAKIIIKGESVRLGSGDKVFTVPGEYLVSIEVVKEPVREHLLDQYYEQTLDKCLEDGSEHHIYLAEISLMQVGPSFIIEKIEQVPFGQYIRNPNLIERLEGKKESLDKENWEGIDAASATINMIKNDMEPSVNVRYQKEKKSLGFDFKIPEPGFTGRFSSGVVEIKFGRGAKSGDVFYSDEIEHKLGAGNVCLSMGILEDYEAIGDGKVFLGDLSLFKDARIPDVSLGAVVYPDTGKFKLGFRLKNDTKFGSVVVKWWAYVV